MKKLAIITNDDICFYGGGDRYAIQLSNYLKKYFDYEIILFSTSSNNIKRMKISDIKNMTKADIEFYKTLNLPILEEKIPISFKLNRLLYTVDVIYYIGSSTATNLFLILFSRVFNKRLVKGLHDSGTFREIPMNNNKIRQILIKVYNPFKFFIQLKYPRIHVLNSDDKKKLQSLGYKRKIYLIPNFLYTKSQIQKYKKKNQKFTLLFVGRLDQHKGLDFLSEILDKILKWNNKINVKIVGSGEDGEKLISKLQKKYPRNVRVMGFLSGNDLDNEYKNSDLFLMTSRNEAFSLVTLEAQSFGLPVISFNIKGPRDILTTVVPKEDT